MNIFKKFSLKSDTTPILWAVLLIPKKDSVSIKINSFRKNEKNEPFFEYGKVKYFIHNEKITLLDNKLTLLYKINVSEPINISGTTEEIIFSKELTDALKSKVIKEFRTVENIEVIEEIRKKLDLVMVISGVVAIILLLTYMKVKGLNEIVDIDLKEIKSLVESIKVF